MTGAIPSEIGQIEQLETIDLGKLFLCEWACAVHKCMRYMRVVLYCVDDIIYHYMCGFCIDICELYMYDIVTHDSMCLMFVYVNEGGNMLAGTIPTQIGSITGLLEIKLDGNELTGVIPSEFGQIVTLKEISLGKNMLIVKA